MHRSWFLLLALLPTACAAPDESPAALDAPHPVFDGADAIGLAGELADELVAPTLSQPGLEGTGLTLMRSQVDSLGWAHVRYQQTFEDVPVFGGELIAHFEPDGRPGPLTDDRLTGIDLDVSADIDAAEAIALALDQMDLQLTSEPVADLFVLRHDKDDHLAWRVQLEQLSADLPPTRPVVFVDAHTGELVWTYENLHTATSRSRFCIHCC